MNDEVADLGLARGRVRLVAADASWAAAYQREAERLTALVADAHLSPLLFEHIGSTAVPGLIAKPIIDFMAGFDANVDPSSYFDIFRTAGYEHRGPQGVPTRDLFVRGPTSLRTHHLNLVRANGAFWHDHLIFRDRLRNQPQLLAAYAELKRRLANLHPGDRGQYTAAKAAFVHRVVAGENRAPAS